MKGNSQMIRGTSSAGRFDIYEPVEVLWFGYMEEIVCNRDSEAAIMVMSFIDSRYSMP